MPARVTAGSASTSASAGYRAIEFIRTGTEIDASGRPVEDSGWLAPVVLAEKCVGCGLCQTRCRAINVLAKNLLAESAIRVVAGEGKEDRLRGGSYRALREEEQKAKAIPPASHRGDDYLPDFIN